MLHYVAFTELSLSRLKFEIKFKRSKYKFNCLTYHRSIILMDVMQEVLVPRFTVDSNRKPNIVRYLVKKRLKRFIDNRQSLFERVYPVKLR
ncbi:adenylate kinase 9-like, partial [Brachionus plicatilis]